MSDFKGPFADTERQMIIEKQLLQAEGIDPTTPGATNIRRIVARAASRIVELEYALERLRSTQGQVSLESADNVR